MIFPAKFVSPQSARITTKTTTQVSPTHSGLSRASSVGNTHRFSIELKTKPLSYPDVMELFAFVASLSGQHRHCLLANPLPSVGVGLGNATLREQAAQGADFIAVNASARSVLGALLPGDFVQFANHSKVYIVTTKANTNGLGQSSFSVYPRLRKAVPVGTVVTSGADVRFSMSLDTDDQDIMLAAHTKQLNTLVIDFTERHYD